MRAVVVCHLLWLAALPAVFAATPIASTRHGAITAEELEAYLVANYSVTVISPAGREDVLTPVRVFLSRMVRDYHIAQGATEEVFAAQTELRVVVRDAEAQYLSTWLREIHLSRTCLPDEAEVQAYYTSHRDEFLRPARVAFRHIFAEGRGGEAVRAEARRRIEQALAEIEAGKPFEDVANAYSDVRREHGRPGDVRDVAVGRLSEQVDAVLRELEPGEHSGIVATAYGFNVFQVVSRQAERVEPLEQARAHIRTTLQLACLPEARAALDEAVKGTVPLETFWENAKEAETSQAPLFVVGDEEPVTVRDYWALRHTLRPTEDCLCAATDETGLLAWAASYRDAAYVRLGGLLAQATDAAKLEAVRARTIADYFLMLQARTRFGTPDEAALRAYHAQDPERFARPMRHSGRRLALGPREPLSLSPPERHEALENARQQALALRRHAEEGADFAALARAHSMLSDATAGGWLPLAESHGALFDIHTQDLAPGGISEPVPWDNKVYLFQLEQRIPAEPQPFEAVQEQVRQAWLAEHRKIVDEEWLARIVSEVDLRIDEAAARAWLERRFGEALIR